MAAAGTVRINRFFSVLNQKYDAEVRRHLSQVYLLLGCTIATSAFGSMLQLHHVLDLGMLAGIACVVLVLALLCQRDNGKNYYTRLSMLLGFSFCSGQTLGPLLQYVMTINPSIVAAALVGTFTIFVSLSLAALLSERGKFLYLGGLITSVINTMALITLLSYMFTSYFAQSVELYVGVFLMTSFVLYDTQNIVEECRAGRRDAVQHVLDLFFNVLGIFRRLLMLLTRKEERRNEERRKED